MLMTSIAALLKTMGYRAWLPEEYQGAAIWHEIDVEATKDGKHHAIEVKFRNDNRDHVRSQDVMVAHARFLDLGKKSVIETVITEIQLKISKKVTRSQFI